jgi:hypothetical protein
MYPKREVRFIAVLFLLASCLTMLQPTPTNVSVDGPALTLADGTHPPPPTPKLSEFEGAQELRADGTHPPPPPWLASIVSVA